MEGEVCRLQEIIAIKKKCAPRFLFSSSFSSPAACVVVTNARRYNCFLYLDEAHSIGAMGTSIRRNLLRNPLDYRNVAPSLDDGNRRRLG